MKLWNMFFSAGIFVFRKNNMNEHHLHAEIGGRENEPNKNVIISSIPVPTKFAIFEKFLSEPPETATFNESSIDHMIDIYNMQKELETWKQYKKTPSCLSSIHLMRQNTIEMGNIWEGGLFHDWMVIL
jgi:hypothetical protein